MNQFEVCVIRQHETFDHCGFGTCFNMEIYTDDEVAQKRFDTLNATNEESSGLFYSLEEVMVNKNNN